MSQQTCNDTKIRKQYIYNHRNKSCYTTNTKQTIMHCSINNLYVQYVVKLRNISIMPCSLIVLTTICIIFVNIFILNTIKVFKNVDKYYNEPFLNIHRAGIIELSRFSKKK